MRLGEVCGINTAVMCVVCRRPFVYCCLVISLLRLSVIHALSNFNLYDDAVLESVDNFDDLSDAISDPTTL